MARALSPPSSSRREAECYRAAFVVQAALVAGGERNALLRNRVREDPAQRRQNCR